MLSAASRKVSVTTLHPRALVGLSSFVGTIAPATASCCHLFSTQSTSSESTENPPVRPIPDPPGKYPIVGHLPRLLKGEGVKTWSDMFVESNSPIYNVHAMLPSGKPMVVTRDPDHAKEILMNQGEFTVRTHQESWEYIFDKNGWPQGIPQSTGEDWKRRRKVLGETLLQQKNSKQYVPLIVPIANRFVDCWEAHVDPSTGRFRTNVDVPVSVRTLTGMFALDAVMKVVTGADVEACSPHPPLPAEAVSFCKSIETMFNETTEVQKFLPYHLNFPNHSKSMRRLEEAWKEMYRFCSKFLTPIVDEYQQAGNVVPDRVKGTVLPKLFEEHEAGTLSMDEVLGVAVTAISGAVDTTGQTTEYICYNLARNPDVQEKLYQYVKAPAGGGKELDWSIEDYELQKYLVAVVKESMRITPTIGAHARTLVKDAELTKYGYEDVPEGTLTLINYLEMTQDSQLFPQPHLFLPERFLKAPKNGKTQDEDAAVGCPYHAEKTQAIEQGDAVCKSPYAAIPFGHGARKCVGKAFAEMDMHLAIAALLRRFKIEYDGPDLRQQERNLLRPVESLTPHFRFIPRD